MENGFNHPREGIPYVSSSMEKLFLEIFSLSYDQPLRFRSQVQQRILRSRSLSSKKRQRLSALLYRALRFRETLFPEGMPQSIDLDELESNVEKCEQTPLEVYTELWSKHQDLASLSTALSFPVWMMEIFFRDFGESKAIELAYHLNQEAKIFLRVNQIKTTREKLVAQLEKKKLYMRESDHPWALEVLQRINLRALPEFKKGEFEIQDLGSQMIAWESQVKPRQLVIDGCARTGGKSLAMAMMMNNQGRIIAADVDTRVFDEMEKRAKRSGVSILETAWIAPDDPQPLAQYHEKADVVLVDAPCTGSGTLSRRPWMKWSMQPLFVEELALKQRSILERQSRWVKPGGRMVYSTCSLFDQENQTVIEGFLSDHPEWALSQQKLLMPGASGHDGYFVASLVRQS
ncbi:MAG: RsmB/NOP family class I SAM-dependent RNA methyltransferase [Bdellovibrionota bacterium]